MRDPLLLPCCAVAGGVLLVRFTGLPLRQAALCLGLSFVLGVLAQWRARKALQLTCWLCFSFFLGAGSAAYHKAPKTPKLDAEAREVLTFSGCVVDPAIFSVDREQFTLELSPHARVRVSLRIPEGETPPNLHYGQLAEIEGQARLPRNFGNPGAFDYVSYLARQEVYWDVPARLGSLRVIPGRCGSRFWKIVFDLRQLALERIDALYPNDDYAAGMMRAILIGDTSHVEKGWTENFRNTGTFHALVISGLHVTVLAGTLLFLLRMCFLPEQLALLVTAQAAWLYAFVSGCSAPAVRAAAGFTLFLIARFVFRRTRILNLLAAIAIGYLLFDPGELYDASFQLSFFSVATIGALAAPLLDRYVKQYLLGAAALADPDRDNPHQPKIAQWRIEWRLAAETISLLLRISFTRTAALTGFVLGRFFASMQLVVISSLVQIGLALPMLSYFHRLSITGLSANLFVIPLMEMLVPIGFCALFTGWTWVAKCALLCLTLSRWVADWHMKFEPTTRTPDSPLWLALAFCAALAAWAVALRHRRWGLQCGLAAIGLLAVMLAHPFRPRVQPGSLEMTAIDVGQGDSLLLAFPRGAMVLVDAGGIPSFGQKRKPKIEIGEDVVSPYLWSRGIRKLSAVVCTHAHADHSGGLISVMRNFHPDALWTGANSDSRDWIPLRDEAIRLGIRIIPMLAGSEFIYSGAHVRVLSPPSDYEAAEAAKNNDSLAFRLSYGWHSFLLTGDMERPMEERIVAEHALSPIDVLKVGHHGSKTSSSEEFLELAQPKFALISLGADNMYHFPHPSVMQRLGERHVAVFRTDESGQVTFLTDGRRLTVHTWRESNPSPPGDMP